MSGSLLHAFIIEPGGAAEAVDQARVDAWRPEQGILWLHMDVNAPETRRWLSKQPGIPRMVPEALVAEETRPRATIVGDGLLLLLRGVNLNPGADPEDMVSLRMWVDGHRVISTRRRKLLSVADAVASLEHTPTSGTADLMLRIVDRLIDRIGDAVSGVEDRIEDIEERVLEEPGQSMRAELSDLRRETIALKRYLSPQREALGRLYATPLPWFTDLDQGRLREDYDRLLRQVEDLDAVRERASVVHEELVSRLSDELNKRMYLLAIVAALFLPLSFLTGLLGINVGGIPGADSPYGFTLFSVLLAALLSMQIWFFLRKKWF